jgi:hypothetical protein
MCVISLSLRPVPTGSRSSARSQADAWRSSCSRSLTNLLCQFEGLKRPIMQPRECGSTTGSACCPMSWLFERYPTLGGWLLLQVWRRRISLEEIDTEGRLRARFRGLQSVHEESLRQCGAVGLTGADYPFSTAGRALIVPGACGRIPGLGGATENRTGYAAGLNYPAAKR